MQGMPVQLPETFSQNPGGAEIGLWPLAWGWWLLIAVTIITLTLVVLWYRSYRQKRQVLRQALKAIKSLDIESPDFYAQCNHIIKRTFLSYFPEKSVASLHGERWQTFLRQNLSDKQQNSLAPLIEHLGASMYLADVKQTATDKSRNMALKLLLASLPPGKKQLLAVGEAV